MRRVFSIAVLAVALILFTQQSHATPIIYVESGQLSGTLGNTVLTNASFTFTFIGDTNNIFTVPGSGSQILPAFLNPAISNTIVIGGSTGTFTNALLAFVDPPGAFIGVIDWATRGFQISFFNAGTVGYNLATSIGPLTSGTFVRASGSATTSLGTLTLNPQGAQNLSFTATLIPEPETLGLSAVVLLGIILVGVRKTGSTRF